MFILGTIETISTIPSKIQFQLYPPKFGKSRKSKTRYWPRFSPPWDRPEARVVPGEGRRDNASCRKWLPIVPTVPRWISSCGGVSAWPLARLRVHWDSIDKDARRDKRLAVRGATRRRLPSLPRIHRDTNRDMPRLKQSKRHFHSSNQMRFHIYFTF